MVNDQSERLMDSAYSSAWVDFDARSRRSLLTFSMVVGQPLKIKVGKMYTLNKETFLQVLNGSYAMFNMLYGSQSSK
ncbi:odorant receptor 43a-like [Schistocerca nitens]|uniref:odorant receptor 43a-like n=1 Tax=Schistocerca nitens TaxID=7011 RepID=UPI00211837EB|nr:odorant receptor 43a-like [Schistocerca nitens]